MPFTLSVTVGNSVIGNFPAHDVVVSVELPIDVGNDALPQDCSRTSASIIECNAGTLRYDAKFLLPLRAPSSLRGGTLQFQATARSSDVLASVPNIAKLQTVVSRGIVVTNTADSGPGSLRAAIEEANATCVTYDDRCAVMFTIDEPSPHPWKTIRLASELPLLNAFALHIDGATQTAYSGEANPGGPPIEVTGGGRIAGDGFQLCCGYSAIKNLAINGFGRFGVLMFSGLLSNNFIGTDATGSAAVPNGRGIGVIGRGLSTIYANVISGNVHSGIFAMQAYSMRIVENRIGVAAQTDTPVPNGASGIYVAADAGGWADLDDNVIAFNGQMGIAIDRNSDYVGGYGNRIWANGGLAIDDGLDGPTYDVHTRYYGPLAAPVITQATYFADNDETVIRGTFSSIGFETFVFVDLYASDAPHDAQRFLGHSITSWNNFGLVVKGDLRGQWITALTILGDYMISDDYPRRMTELSVPVQVEGR